jgi:peptide/nickel transport system substrate-binding protein
MPSFFDAIVGARRCVRKPRACDLSAGIVTDARERTITLHLARPDPYLLHELANPLAYIVPAERPFGPGRKTPGTGPYRVVGFDPERGVELTRNPYFRVWSQDARPDGLADRIRVRVAEGAGAGVTAVERGDADVVTLADAFGASVSPREIDALAARHADRLHTSARTAGRQVTVSVPADKRRVGRYIAALLERLGYRSRLRVFAGYGDFHEYVADSRHGAQIGTDGWVRDRR